MYPCWCFVYPGTYIVIEASRRNNGDRARLLGDWMPADEPFCLQFWYHMFGQHTGSLNVYIKKNSSHVEQLVWQQKGNQGNRWIFAQTTVNASSAFKVKVLCSTLTALDDGGLSWLIVWIVLIIFPACEKDSCPETNWFSVQNVAATFPWIYCRFHWVGYIWVQCLCPVVYFGRSNWERQWRRHGSGRLDNSGGCMPDHHSPR